MKEFIKAPLPGKILNVLVKEGDQISRKDPVVILEAMKMHNEILAGFDGTVIKIFVTSEQAVPKNHFLVEIERN
jgi:biotin carboxyl carrier protein